MNKDLNKQLEEEAKEYCEFVYAGHEALPEEETAQERADCIEHYKIIPQCVLDYVIERAIELAREKEFIKREIPAPYGGTRIAETYSYKTLDEIKSIIKGEVL
jgi:hypothetical protein